MSDSPAEIVYQLLLDLGVVEESASWPLFVTFLPDPPDTDPEAVCVYDTAGAQDGRLMATGERIDHPGFQIRVRGRQYASTWRKADAIAKALDGVQRVSVAFSSGQSYTVHNVSRTGQVLSLGMDDQDTHRCYHFTINGVLTVTEDE